MSNAEIIEFCEANRFHYKNTIHFTALVQKTKFLDEKYEKIGLYQRLWHLINENYEIQNCLMCGKPCIFSSEQKRYNITCSRECNEKYLVSDIKKEKYRNTCLEKYGVDHSSKTSENKEKITKINKERNKEEKEKIQENYKKTCLRKYGVEYVMRNERIKEKYKNTIKEKYKVDSPFKLDEVKEKIRKTNLKKYGTEYAVKNADVRKNLSRTLLSRTKDELENTIKKYKKTCLEKYGTENVHNNIDIKNKLQKQIDENFKQKFHELDWNDYEYVKRIDGRTHLIFCKKCQKEFEINSSNQLFGRKKRNHEICTNCNPLNKNYSVSEKEIIDFIRSIYDGEIVENSRLAIRPYEIDIYLPELNLAIEYNGLYWHSEENISRNYHEMKSNLCKDKGIHLIHIFEDDWMFKQEIIKSIIKNFINSKNQRTIYARNCEIKEIKFRECNDFLNGNHLLGAISSFSKCYGLLYNNEPVSLMSFKLVNKEKNNYELNRYAIKLNHKIIGGANKLFRKFISENEFSEIVTYNDNAVFKGDVYKKLGFSYIRTNAPNYQFITKHEPIRIPKQSIRKLKIGYKKENEKSLKYIRVYNAGNDVYKFII